MKETPSLIKIIEDGIKKGWNTPSLSDYMGKTYLYKDIARMIEELHIIYAQAGVKSGDKIALCGANSARWGVVFISVLTYGAVPVPILNDFSPEQIQNIVNHSDTTLLFASVAIHKTIKAEEMPLLRGIMIIEDFSITTSRTEKLSYAHENITTLFEQKHPNGFDESSICYQAESSFEDLAMINYTSGTTGFSKGVMIPYRALWSNYDFAVQTLGKILSKNNCIISLLPMAHMYGMMFEFFFEFINGCHIYFLSTTPTPAIIAKAFSQIRPRLIVAVPLIIEKMVKKQIMPKLAKSKASKYINTPIIGYFVRKAVRKQVMKAFGGNVYEVIVGGAALNRKIESFLHSINFPLSVGYGATECAPIITYEVWQRMKPGSCGKAVVHMEVKIDSTSPTTIPGEIMVRGLNVFSGYYKNAEASAQAIDSHGWYHTGDLGIIDKKGNTFIKGRLKNMILGSSGQNIYPEEIEDQLNSMLMVSESIIVQRDGHLEALVYPDYEEAKSFNLTDENINNIMQLNRTDINELRPAYERIQAIHVQKTEFEKTAKKSIKRFLYK